MIQFHVLFKVHDEISRKIKWLGRCIREISAVFFIPVSSKAGPRSLAKYKDFCHFAGSRRKSIFLLSGNSPFDSYIS